MVNTHELTILEQIEKLLRELSEENRLEVFHGLNLYCRYCGEETNGRECYCWNDE